MANNKINSLILFGILVTILQMFCKFALFHCGEGWDFLWNVGGDRRRRINIFKYLQPRQLRLVSKEITMIRIQIASASRFRIRSQMHRCLARIAPFHSQKKGTIINFFMVPFLLQPTICSDEQINQISKYNLQKQMSNSKKRGRVLQWSEGFYVRFWFVL